MIKKHIFICTLQHQGRNIGPDSFDVKFCRQNLVCTDRKLRGGYSWSSYALLCSSIVSFSQLQTCGVDFPFACLEATKASH